MVLHFILAKNICSHWLLSIAFTALGTSLKAAHTYIPNENSFKVRQRGVFLEE